MRFDTTAVAFPEQAKLHLVARPLDSGGCVVEGFQENHSPMPQGCVLTRKQKKMEHFRFHLVSVAVVVAGAVGFADVVLVGFGSR